MSANGRLVVFDMDGTLTKPFLDFNLIREEIGLAPGPILESVESLAPAERVRAEAILVRHEAEAAAASELQPGAADVVAAIRSAGIPVALMTRNSRLSVDAFRERHGLDFDLVWTREDGPMKPSPAPVFEICRRLGVAAEDTWVVGDFHYDVLCGKAAGAMTVLLLDGTQPRPAWAEEAHYVIYALPELLAHMEIEAEAGPALTPRNDRCSQHSP